MKSKTIRPQATPLSRALPRATFAESHHRIIDAPAQDVWGALHALSWDDMRLTRPFLEVRGISADARGRTWMQSFAERGHTDATEPRHTMFLVVGKPWTTSGASAPTQTLSEAIAFDEPGWLKYGMEWQVHPLPGERTLVETRTLCEPTSLGSLLRFTPYWAFIRPFSGLIRREMLACVARQVEGSGRRDRTLAHDS